MRQKLLAGVLLVIAVLLLVGPVSAATPWYSTYGFRILHNVTGDAGWTGDESFYQMMFHMNSGYGVSSGNIIYTNGSTMVNWNDTRFTLADGTTLLNYYLEKGSNSSAANIWVEFPVITKVGTTQIYVYYNKSGDISASNGWTTFPRLFDDFNSSSISNVWGSPFGTGGGTVVVSSGSLNMTPGMNNGEYIRTTNTIAAPYKMISRENATQAAAPYIMLGYENDASLPNTTYGSGAVGYRNDISDTVLTGINMQKYTGSWSNLYQSAYAGLSNSIDYKIELMALPTGTTMNLSYFTDDWGTLLKSGTHTDTTYTSGYQGFISYGGPLTNQHSYIDFAFIANYTSNGVEPTNGAWGAVQTNGGGVTAPNASFVASPISGIAPLTVSFTDTSTNMPTGWNWSIKNATVGWALFSSVQNPSLTLPMGTYDVNLTVANAGGSNTSTQLAYIVVGSNEPLSNFTHFVTLNVVGTTVGAQTGYDIPIFVTNGTLSTELNVKDNTNVVTDNFTQWLQYTLPIRRYVDAQQPIIGINFSSNWSNNQVNDQNFLDDNGTLRCYYEGVYSPNGGSSFTTQGIGVASVSESQLKFHGVNAIWTNNATPVIISPNTIRMGTVLEITNASSPTGATYYMYTAEQSGSYNQIDVYMGNVYNSFTKVGTNIVPPHGSEIFTQNPQVIREGPTTWEMYYDVENGDGSWGVDVATSSDGISWTYSAQVFSTTSAGQAWSAQKIEHISAMKVGNEYVVTYEAADDGSYDHWGVGMAYSTTFNSGFTQFNGNPILEGDRSDLALESYGDAATPAWVKCNGVWYFSIAGTPHYTGLTWQSDWGIELYPVAMPAIAVTGTRPDFSDVRFSNDGTTQLNYNRVDYDYGNWAKFFVQENTPAQTYSATNVALATNGATATASSGASPGNAIDGNYGTEWTSVGSPGSSWLNISLATTDDLGEIVIHGSSSSTEGLNGGHILFSDGTTVRFGELPNPGSSTADQVVEFTPRNVSWFTIYTDYAWVGDTNIGIMEVQAYNWSAGSYRGTTNLYYGDPLAIDNSTATIFNLWDNFATWNTTQWGTQPAWASITNGYLLLTGAAGAASEVLTSAGNMPANTILDAKTSINSTNNYAWVAYGADKMTGSEEMIYQGSASSMQYYTNGGSGNTLANFWVGKVVTGQWQGTDIARIGSTTAYFWNLPAGAQNVGKAETSTTNIPATTPEQITMGVNAGASTPSAMSVKYIDIRPYVYPEPYFSATNYSQSAPVASFTGTPTSGGSPLLVQFTDSSTGSPTSWAWTFGDSNYTANTTENPSHLYTAPGTYTVTLKVTSEAGSNTSTQTNYIVSTIPSLSANFTANQTINSVYAMPVVFNDTSTGTNITTWNWTFNDGYTSTLQNPVHYFDVAGNYTVNLTVTNATGGSSTISSTNLIVLSADQDSNLKSWLHFNTSATQDLMGNAWTAAGGAALVASPARFSTGSLSIAANGANINTPSSAVWSTARDFTLEFWLYPTSHGGAGNIVSRTTAAGTGTGSGWGLYNTGSTSGYEFWMGSLANATSTFSLTDSVWQMVTVQRISGTLYVSVNGTQVATKSQPGSYDTANPVYIGKGFGGAGQQFNMDEFRFSSSARWYVQPFTAPTAQYNGIITSLTNENLNAILRYKTDPANASFAIIYNQTGNGIRNRTVQIQNITKANSISFSVTFDPLQEQIGNIFPNYTNYPDLIINSNSVDNVNGLCYINVTRANSNNPITALFNNRTNLVDIQILYYNYTPAANFSTFFGNASILDNTTSIMYGIENFIATPVTYGAWDWFPNFTTSNTTTITGSPVTFTDTTVGYPNRWSWNFGDGATLNNQTTGTAVHTYSAAGTYTVSMMPYLWQNSSIDNSSIKSNYITVSAAPITPNFTQQDLYQSGAYLQTFHITDSLSGSPIPVVTITDGNGQSYTTSNGTGYLTESAGVQVFYFASTNYVSTSTSAVVDAAASYSIQMSGVTSTPGQQTWYTPKQIGVTVVYYSPSGVHVPGANISLAVVGSDLQDNTQLETLFGINPTAANQMANGTLLMNGITGGDGAAAFTVLSSLRYTASVTDPKTGLVYIATLSPGLDPYTVWIGSNPLVQNKTAAMTMNNTRLWVSQPDPGNVTDNMAYQDTSGYTTDVQFIVVTANNMTTIVQDDLGNPGTGMVLANYTHPNQRGQGYYYYYNATRNIP